MQPNFLSVGLIEDDPVMGGSIVQRLELEGCSVQWWKSGGDMVAVPTEKIRQLDIMVCDIRLPDMNGEDVYRRINAEGNVPPFIFITGFGEIDQAVRLMRMGAADYITKPFQFDEFFLVFIKGLLEPIAAALLAGKQGIGFHFGERTLAPIARLADDETA